MNPDGFLPLEHPPGAARVDFGEARFIENGVAYDGYYLNMSYPHSDGDHMQLFNSANQEFFKLPKVPLMGLRRTCIQYIIHICLRFFNSC